jgi:hypothetical protein
MSVAHAENALLEAALSYAARGWPVMPLHSVQQVAGGPAVCDCRKSNCDSPAKHPRTRDGLKSASTDPEQIKKWWGMWPRSNIGIRTGEIGPGRYLTVLDVDPRSGGNEALEALLQTHGQLPDTMVALTGGGGFHYFLEGSQPIKTTSHRLGHGLDTRGGGGQYGAGYVVAAPSQHISGKFYEWELSSPDKPLEPPQWLVLATNGNTSTAQTNLPADGAPIIDGQAGGVGRKRTLHSLGRTMRARGLTGEEIFAALAAVNASRCNPPLDEKDVRRVAEHAARVPPGVSPGYAAKRRLHVVRPGEPTDGAGFGMREPGEDTEERWEDQLRRNEEGAIKSTFGNLCLILRHSPAWKGRLSYNEQALKPLLDERALNDGDIGRMREQVERLYGIAPGADNLGHAALTVAQEKPFHPLRAFLDALPAWDGTKRIERVAREILNCESVTTLVNKMLRAWFVALIARARQPGCKVDNVLCLVGRQGARKSTFFAEIGGDWFSDSHMDISNKDSYMQLAESWIFEWGEIERMTARRGNEEIKSFLTSRADTFRPPYAKSIQRVPRACLVVGTTNREEFLSDPTGSRRFWIVRVGDRVEIRLLREWRAQLLAEALAAFNAGESWWLEGDDDVAREDAASDHIQVDTWVDAVVEWLAGRAPDAKPPSTKQVLSGALRVEIKDHTPDRMQRVGNVMRSLGFDSKRVHEGTFGKQRVWVKHEECQGVRNE